MATAYLDARRMQLVARRLRDLALLADRRVRDVSMVAQVGIDKESYIVLFHEGLQGMRYCVSDSFLEILAKEFIFSTLVPRYSKGTEDDFFKNFKIRFRPMKDHVSRNPANADAMGDTLLDRLVAHDHTSSYRNFFPKTDPEEPENVRLVAEEFLKNDLDEVQKSIELISALEGD